ncbi:hypothetical protein L1987_31366 [Smallanthus sonchifolius]|uniref:Uncharacterized protein n=1 Tax=Smallanthus sonchifolius TaxID=185202 RepID=A0ACB9I837_9ASTR|nr:hypothetical protein L1987_31366 [Smallanthus sonchifolius]
MVTVFERRVNLLCEIGCDRFLLMLLPVVRSGLKIKRICMINWLVRLLKKLLRAIIGSFLLTGASKEPNFIVLKLTIGAVALLIGFISSGLIIRQRKKDHKKEPEGSNFHVSSMSNATSEGAQCSTLSELRSATDNFQKKVVSGGFGTVYFGIK